jgi:hypothetical protein
MGQQTIEIIDTDKGENYSKRQLRAGGGVNGFPPNPIEDVLLAVDVFAGVMYKDPTLSSIGAGWTGVGEVGGGFLRMQFAAKVTITR